MRPNKMISRDRKMPETIDALGQNLFEYQAAQPSTTCLRTAILVMLAQIMGAREYYEPRAYMTSAK